MRPGVVPSAKRDTAGARSKRHNARLYLALVAVAGLAAFGGYVGGSGSLPFDHSRDGSREASTGIHRIGTGRAAEGRGLSASLLARHSGHHGKSDDGREDAPRWSWASGGDSTAEHSTVEEPKVVAQHAAGGSGSGSEAVPDRMIVVARGKEDISYLSIFLPDIPHTVYQGGWRPEHKLLDHGLEPKFKAGVQAKETNVYLQYIVSHYDKLPASVAFIHAHRHSWHARDIVDVLRSLRWGEVPFANLRYKNYSDWDCGPGYLFPCDWSGSVLTPHEPGGPTYSSQPDFGSVRIIGGMVAHHWPIFFEQELGPLPEVIHAPCCAEFVVSRERIQARPKAFYERALEIANSLDADTDHVDIALTFEYAWHMIFGEPAVLFPLEKCVLLNCDADAA